MHSAKALKWMAPALIFSTLAYPAIKSIHKNTEDLSNVLQRREVRFMQGTLPQLSPALAEQQMGPDGACRVLGTPGCCPKALCSQSKSYLTPNHLVKLLASLQTS
jgi:hypothetical protein